MTSPSDDYCLIPLTQGQFAKVSPHRFEYLSKFKWGALWDTCTQSYYARRSVYRAGRNPGCVKMHRLILGLEEGDPRQPDHKNHDTLDNRDTNLRIADRSDQVRNRRNLRSNSTGFKGVSYFRDGPKYRACISVGGKRLSLGLYPFTEEGKIAAARPYDAAAKEHFGEFAHLNFPP